MSYSYEADPNSEHLYLSFNQTSTSICVGGKTGFTLYDFYSAYDCQLLFESRLLKDICIIERSFSTYLVAYVTLEKPRNMVLYHLSKGVNIVEKLFPNTVLSVKLNRSTVVVCLEDCIYIMQVSKLDDEHIHIITNTPINTKGLIALTYGLANVSVLAYPGSAVTGDVQIFDCITLHPKITIQAHTSQLAALAFDENGEKIATASIKGTVIRVFNVSNGEVLFEFRRGVRRCVEIKSLSFSKEYDLLCASSNTETIHIFKLCNAESPEPQEDEPEGWFEMFGRVLTQSAKYLPTQVSDVITQQRAFATVMLPSVTQRAICTISIINSVPYLVAASLEGFLYIYDLNLEQGGSCHLLKQHRLHGARLHPPPNSLRQLPEPSSPVKEEAAAAAAAASKEDSKDPKPPPIDPSMQIAMCIADLDALVEKHSKNMRPMERDTLINL